MSDWRMTPEEWEMVLGEIMYAEDENLGCSMTDDPNIRPLFCCQWNKRTGDDRCAECRALEDRIRRAVETVVDRRV